MKNLFLIVFTLYSIFFVFSCQGREENEIIITEIEQVPGPCLVVSPRDLVLDDYSTIVFEGNVVVFGEVDGIFSTNTLFKPNVTAHGEDLYIEALTVSLDIESRDEDIPSIMLSNMIDSVVVFLGNRRMSAPFLDKMYVSGEMLSTSILAEVVDGAIAISKGQTSSLEVRVYPKKEHAFNENTTFLFRMSVNPDDVKGWEVDTATEDYEVVVKGEAYGFYQTVLFKGPCQIDIDFDDSEYDVFLDANGAVVSVVCEIEIEIEVCEDVYISKNVRNVGGPGLSQASFDVAFEDNAGNIMTDVVNHAFAMDASGNETGNWYFVSEGDGEDFTIYGGYSNAQPGWYRMVVKKIYFHDEDGNTVSSQEFNYATEYFQFN
jgi:hypothetical protein